VKWTAKPDGSGGDLPSLSPIAESLAVYAQWEPESYTVIFNKNGGIY
jgi:hypothetical protein